MSFDFNCQNSVFFPFYVNYCVGLLTNALKMGEDNGWVLVFSGKTYKVTYFLQIFVRIPEESPIFVLKSEMARTLRSCDASLSPCFLTTPQPLTVGSVKFQRLKAKHVLVFPIIYNRNSLSFCAFLLVFNHEMYAPVTVASRINTRPFSRGHLSNEGLFYTIFFYQIFHVIFFSGQR